MILYQVSVGSKDSFQECVVYFLFDLKHQGLTSKVNHYAYVYQTMQYQPKIYNTN